MRKTVILAAIVLAGITVALAQLKNFTPVTAKMPDLRCATIQPAQPDQ
jgi:hypothetical protein